MNITEDSSVGINFKNNKILQVNAVMENKTMRLFNFEIIKDNDIERQIM